MFGVSQHTSNPSTWTPDPHGSRFGPECLDAPEATSDTPNRQCMWVAENCMCNPRQPFLAPDARKLVLCFARQSDRLANQHVRTGNMNAVRAVSSSCRSADADCDPQKFRPGRLWAKFGRR